MTHCNQCGLDWTPRVPNPRACPGCKRYDWNESKKGAAKVAVRPPLTPRAIPEVLSEVVQDRVGKERVSQVPRSRQQTPKAAGKGLRDLRDGVVGGGEKGVVGSDALVGGDEETLAPDDFIPESARKGHKCPRCEKANTVTPWGPGQMRCSTCGINFGV